MALVGAQFVNAVSPNPVGSLQAYAGASAPTGWLLCDNSEQPISTYPELYSVLGTTYGALTNGSGGAGSTHFRLPDLRGRMPIGAGNDGTTENNVARTRGSKGGDTRIGNHSHPYGSVTTSGGSVNAGGDIIWAVSGGNVVDKNGTGYLNTKAVGGGTGDNMPPFLVTNYIIKAQSDAPRSGLAYGSTPPIVTQLPSNPQFGDVVTYYSSSPYAGYQTQQWNGSSWLVLSDSREYGAWQDWVPSVTQSSSISGTYYARWKQVGKTVTGYVGFTASSSGTAGQWWLCSLPVNAKATGPIVGAGWVFDSSTSIRYAAVGELINGGQFGFVGDWSGGNLWGAVPSIAVASGDQFRMTLQYEAA